MDEALLVDAAVPELDWPKPVFTRWMEGIRARGRGRGDGELSRLWKALAEGDAEADIMAVAGPVQWFWGECLSGM
jgi:hypothetical protein